MVGLGAAAASKLRSRTPVLSSTRRSAVTVGGAAAAERDPTHAAEVEQNEILRRRQKAAFQPTAANINKSDSAENKAPAVIAALKPEAMHEASTSTSVSATVPSEPKASPTDQLT